MATSSTNLAVAAFRTSKRSRGMAVTYRRGSGKSAIEVSLTAVPGRSRTFTEDSNGVSVTGYERDFLIEQADLVNNDVQLVPVAGDLIDLVVGDQTITYEVGPLAGSGKHYEPMGDIGAVLRIHTTHSDTATIEPEADPEA